MPLWLIQSKQIWKEIVNVLLPEKILSIRQAFISQKHIETHQVQRPGEYLLLSTSDVMHNIMSAFYFAKEKIQRIFKKRKYFTMAKAQ